MKALATALVKAQAPGAHPNEESAVLHSMFFAPAKAGRQHEQRPIHERILSRVVCGVSECWHYCGVRNAFGYGRITYKGKTQVVHRLIYEAMNGPIPAGLYALHSCDNPSCVNPAHMRLGTYSDNIRDSYERGRRRPRGHK